MLHDNIPTDETNTGAIDTTDVNMKDLAKRGRQEESNDENLIPPKALRSGEK